MAPGSLLRADPLARRAPHPAPRAVLLSGARQVGKTTPLLQAVQELLARGVQPERILYATFDHPLLKLIGLEGVLDVWREIQPRSKGAEYLLLDEIQYTHNWQTWLKHQVDFEKQTRIVVTGSAVPLETENLESGVGRWHTIRLVTLSFRSTSRSRRSAPSAWHLSYGGLSAYTEGWALYAEELGKKVGLYKDPVSDYGRLNSELFRAVRLVVDIGIHDKGWTRDQVIAYMRQNDVNDVVAQTETDRYSARPSQAMAYKMGQLKIRELRERARQFGARFDFKAFYDEVLTF